MSDFSYLRNDGENDNRNNDNGMNIGMKRIRDWWNRLREYRLWLAVLLLVDALLGLLLWLLDAKSFWSLCGIFSLSSMGLFIILACYIYRRDQRREKKILGFIESPDEFHEAEALEASFPRERKEIEMIGSRMRALEQEIKELKAQLEGQEEYVEAWAHEIKTPLSLMTFLLDNRRDEIPQGIYLRLQHARNQMQEYVNQMLYYERLKAVHKDYIFEKICLSECCEEMLEEYGNLLLESGFVTVCRISEQCKNVEDMDDQVVSDRKGLQFILGQVISNVVKYRKDTGERTLVLELSDEVRELGNDIDRKKGESPEYTILCIRDNGKGVKPHELPFIFDKGFAGDIGVGRKNATGMGLYLVKMMAEDLNIQVEARSEWGVGFEMKLYFPKICKY